METVEKLQVKYEKAVDDNVEFFMFEGEKILTSYAKYLLEYLRMTLKDS